MFVSLVFKSGSEVKVTNSLTLKKRDKALSILDISTDLGFSWFMDMVLHEAHLTSLLSAVGEKDSILSDKTLFV